MQFGFVFIVFNFPLKIAAASCYIEIILKESDNNVKLIVMDRLIALKEQPNQERVLQVLFSSLAIISVQIVSHLVLILFKGIGNGYFARVGHSRLGSKEKDIVPCLGSSVISQYRRYRLGFEKGCS